VYANRGANGIDGLVSTTLGIAANRAVPTVGLLGDLAFLHDSNGLLGSPGFDGDATFVVSDNGGGGIFHFLPPSRVPEFEELFATPQTVDPVVLARAYGVPALRVERAQDVGPAVVASLAEGGIRVIVVPTDRHAVVEQHEAVWSAVSAAWA
jgi:2-succinyl-5-enolpyruvyl-6-hydroxy-3-cyclohexene-1-carboxylate synthase